MDKTATATERIEFAYEIASRAGNALVIAYSGGKDSDVLLDLAVKSEVPFVAQHNLTTADAPPTVYHIRDVFERLRARGITADIKKPDMSMWGLIMKKGMPPTRRVRYCCEYLKERRFDGQHIVSGVRRAESVKRAGRGLHEILHKQKEKRIVYFDENDDSRKMTEICHMKHRIMTNPVIDWTDADIWDYVRENKIKMNPLYEMGLSRVGCVGCPMASRARLREFYLFPKYRKMYIAAFNRMLAERARRGLKNTTWKDGAEVFNWWVYEDYNPDQMTMFDDEEFA
jgi:phosphoadenosine phosphosulfate reductase